MAAPSPSLSMANSVFSLALFKTLSEKDPRANIFYSPFSLSSALAMVLLGARGNTAEEMSKVLGFGEEDYQDHQEESSQSMLCGLTGYLRQWLSPQSGAPTADDTDDDVHTKFGKLLLELNKAEGGYALSVANKLYGDKTFNFLKGFLADLEKYYRTELESVDFKNNAEGARAKINTWMEEKTKGKIKDLLTQGALDNETKLVLVNAIYFKAKWEEPFDSHRTVQFPFRLNKNDTKQVKMMCQETSLPHRAIHKVNIKVLEMPYIYKDISMIILLPDDIKDHTTGLEQLERELTYQNFMNWTRPDRMKGGKVILKIPQFRLEKMYDMNVILQEMGMSDTFTAMSDLSGMSSGKDLVLSKVIHKAFVEVNEQGTEAAAISMSNVVLGLFQSEPTFTFIADHPFLFFIRHNPSKSVLFSGRFCSPP